jgi:hypothetical protein
MEEEQEEIPEREPELPRPIILQENNEDETAERIVDNEEQERNEETNVKEREVYSYIIHGTIDTDESKIDDDETLEARKKYIYDLRYWAWKRLNAELKINQNNVHWDNVLAYNYRHSSDSIWSKMFSPPVYWSPLETLGDVVSRVNEAGIFGKYDFENVELTEANVSIIRTIARQLYVNNTVLLYGFSVGGLVVQRICEILNVCVKNDKLSELILGLILEKDNLKTFKVATFGSIYIAPLSRVKNINLVNYMMVDDVVTRTNFFEFGLGFTVPLSEKFDEEDGELGYIMNKKNERLYQYMIYKDTNVFFLEKWTTSWLLTNHKEEVHKKNFIQYRINELKQAFSKHNPKYDLLFNKLLKNHVASIYKLPFVERENEEEVAVSTTESVEPVTIINITISQPVDTVEELIETAVTFTPDFYEEERNYISERARKTRIENKLRESQQAKYEYEEAQQRILEQGLARAERARRRRGDEVINTPVDKGIRLRRRNAMKQIQEEINDISHHTADNILELHQTQEKPIIIAEEPEEDMLDFSLILGQIEAKAMFLKGDGLLSFRKLTNDAIDRGKRNRDRIPEASSMEIAGGAFRRKKFQNIQPL